MIRFFLFRAKISPRQSVTHFNLTSSVVTIIVIKLVRVVGGTVVAFVPFFLFLIIKIWGVGRSEGVDFYVVKPALFFMCCLT